MPLLRHPPFIASLLLSLCTLTAAHASSELAVHHDGVATAKTAFEQAMVEVEQAALDVKGEADAITPPNAAPGLPPRPNGCVRSMPERPKNLLYSVGTSYSEQIDSNADQCATTYTYQIYRCGGDFQWEDRGTETERVDTNIQCGGES